MQPTCPPFIHPQPQAPTGTVYEGSTVSFNVVGGGALPLALQWTKNGTNLVGKTATNLTLVNLQTSDSGNYAAVVTNAYGSVTSSIIALTVVAGPPVIFTASEIDHQVCGRQALLLRGGRRQRSLHLSMAFWHHRPGRADQCHADPESSQPRRCRHLQRRGEQRLRRQCPVRHLDPGPARQICRRSHGQRRRAPTGV